MTTSNPTITGVHHVGLTVSDLAASQAFFVEQLGFSVLRERPDYPAVILSGPGCMITLWRVEDPETCQSFDRRKNVGLHHLAFAVENRETLSSLYDRFVAAKIEFEFAPTLRADGVSYHMMTLIPGGPRVEFTSAA